MRPRIRRVIADHQFSLSCPKRSHKRCPTIYSLHEMIHRIKVFL
jgi:hypothetical protein